MRVWTVHVAPEATAAAGADPVVLVPEGFAWGAFLFGPVWLAAHRLWLPALALLLLDVALAWLLPPSVVLPVALGVAFLVGAHGRDLQRRALARRGYAAAGVVAEHDLDAATARLLRERPELAAPMARAALA